MNKILKTIYNRKSLRLFSDRKITKKDKEKLFNAARRAPTAGNLMSYTIIDVTDQAIKERLAETCDKQPMIAKAPMVLIFLADMQRLYDYFRYSKVPELCEKKGLIYSTPKEGDLLLAANDAIVAAQNVVIAAESLGMGSCYIGDIIENIEEHREMLLLPPWTFPVTMLIIGYPKKRETKEPVPRFPEKFIVHENSYFRLSDDDFKQMFKETEEPYADAPFVKQAKNLGQHIYIRKFASDYMKELRRSFRKGLREWSGEEPF